MIKNILILLSFCVITISCGNITKLSNASYSNEDEEEMVNIGYGKISKKNLTSSVSSMKVPENTTYNNIYDMIKGRIPGVTVDGTTIRIRGESSIYGSNDPLIIVDGIVMDDISGILPVMVESIDILKDASASAIYGTRAANGVILISLRDGQ